MSKALAVGYNSNAIDTTHGDVSMDKVIYRQLDMKKIKNKERSFVFAEKALKDVIPIEWDDEVVNGNKRVLLVEKSM